MSWIFEYLYDEGLRRGDIISILTDLPSSQLEISDLDSNEPLFHFFDYSLYVLSPVTDDFEKF